MYKQELPLGIFTNPDAPITTSQELNFLRQMAFDFCWTNLLCIGWELHRDNINILIPKKFKGTEKQITFRSAQEILAVYPSLENQERYRRVIDNIENSPGEKNGFCTRERKT